VSTPATNRIHPTTEDIDIDDIPLFSFLNLSLWGVHFAMQSTTYRHLAMLGKRTLTLPRKALHR
jgi:hypothetical protein